MTSDTRPFDSSGSQKCYGLGNEATRLPQKHWLFSEVDPEPITVTFVSKEASTIFKIFTSVVAISGSYLCLKVGLFKAVVIPKQLDFAIL